MRLTSYAQNLLGDPLGLLIAIPGRYSSFYRNLRMSSCVQFGWGAVKDTDGAGVQ
jgi:hypothetical protein